MSCLQGVLPLADLQAVCLVGQLAVVMAVVAVVNAKGKWAVSGVPSNITRHNEANEVRVERVGC